jgi:cation:H+ antiporter
MLRGLTPALAIAQLLLGTIVLYLGAEWLIRGSAAIARAFGVKPLVIGLTVVAYGTSAPELAVSTKTALAHSAPIALGTVIGSCAANISLILGITALISPITIDARIIRREIPILIGSVIALPLLLRNGVLSQLEGGLLIGCAILFTIVTLTISARMEPDNEDEQHTDSSGAFLGGRGRPRTTRGIAALMTGIGILLLVAGSQLFVAGGRRIAAQVGMSERMLGLTVISIGTSLPELIGSIIAATRGQAALAVGSVIGSNLLNVFLVLGVTAYLRPIHLGERMHVVDLVGLVIITLLGVFMLRGSRRISRFEGAILVAAYVGFIVACSIL